jgi:hypothetical protein
MYVVVGNAHRGDEGSTFKDGNVPSAVLVQKYMDPLNVPWTAMDYVVGSENEVFREEGGRTTFRQGYVTGGLAKEVSHRGVTACR